MKTDSNTDNLTEEKSARFEPEGIHPTDKNQQWDRIRGAIKSGLTRKILAMMETCVHCGLCAEACHYYTSTADPSVIPANKIEKFYRFLKDISGAIRPGLFFAKGKRNPDDSALDELYKTAFENCTICGKCALTCPMGINSGEVLLLARTLLCSIGKLPSGLVHPIQTACETGNYLGLSTTDFVETVEWLAEELEDEIPEENFTIPIDKPNTEVLYIPHPLEIRDFPFLFMDAIKILQAAGEDYTVSSDGFDTVNYAYYQGSNKNMMHIAQRILDAREKLGSKSIVMAPCGHGYRVTRWETEKYLGKRHTFPILTIAESIDQYIKTGRLQLKKDVLEGPVTYHDPCQIARRGGVINAPRNVLKAITTNLVEMKPTGVQSFCCGGGGGLASTADFGQIRLQAGKTKAEQIRETGAKIVVTNCFNCKTQIRDLVKKYDLGIEVKSIVERVSASLAELTLALITSKNLRRCNCDQ